MASTNFKTSRWPDGVGEQFVCPYCGTINEHAEGQCPQCRMENTAAGRKATKARIGPWYVLQKRNPAAPGMKFETLLSFVNKGRVKAHSIVRGPTTHQLWKFAAQVRGLSREFGFCYSCGAEIERTAAVCPQCNRTQTLPPQPDAFLETVEAEQPATIYRELPPSAVAPNQAPAAPAPNIDQNAAPANVPHEPPASLDSASPAASNANPPIVDSNSDMIIPSLPDEPPPPIARPTTPRERLANLNRPVTAEDEPTEFDETEDSAFDDGPARPPGQVGPAFVAGGRAPQPPAARRRKWLEAAMFVLVLLAAAGSGLLYVDPSLQKNVQAWANNMLGNIGIASTAKPPITPLAGTDVNSLPQATQTPQPSSFRAPIVHTPPAVPQTLPHIAPALPLPETTTATPPQNISPAAPLIVNDAQPASPPAQPAPVVPPTAPAPTDSTVANDSSTSSQPGDDDPFTKARNLRNKAIDEENSGHYATAVSLFEQIKELPRDAWPGDLELRLKAAKANAEGAPRR